MPLDENPAYMWLGRETPRPSNRGELSSNPKDAIGRNKTPMHLIPSTALVQVAKVMGLGAAKYGPYNWRDASVAATVYISAAQRHIAAFLDGENLDPESGQPHAAHAAACMMILADAFATGNVVDDRPKPGAAAAMLATTPLGMPPAVEAMVHRAAQGQPVEGPLSDQEARLFCQQVKDAATPRPFLWYIATPYSAAPDGKEVAHRLAYMALRELWRRGVRAFCPIAHSHSAGLDLPQDHEFWMTVDRPFMDRCDGLLVFRHAGWKESRGVTEEIQTFSRAGKPVEFVYDPNRWGDRNEKEAGWDALAANLKHLQWSNR